MDHADDRQSAPCGPLPGGGPASATVFFDGACPLCRREIAHYRKLDRAAALDFVDVSAEGAPTPADLTRQQAMARFHVRARDGSIVSGAAAFVEVWALLPGWRWAARLARLPGVVPLLELGYRLFLPVRPYLARTLQRTRPTRDGADAEHDPGTR
jgi:predicted DCC family thiol-disulfide oxidoreductase YuxK